MAYPQLYTRLSNFVRDAYNGLASPSPSGVDAELNALLVSLNAVIMSVRAVTTANGRLQNVAQAVAQALVATWTGPAPASPGPIVTTIAWDSVYSANSMLVVVGGVALAPSAYTVTHVSGFVEVTPSSYPATGASVTVWVFEAGAGLLTNFASTANGKGASLIGIEDPTGVILGTTVETGLVEVATNLAALVANLGALDRYVLANGSVALTDALDAGGNKLTNVAAGVASGDVVTVGQIAGYVDAWSDLAQFFMKRDGTTAMAGPLNFGNNKGQNLADPDLGQPLDAVNVRAMLNSIATNGSSPVGSVVSFAGTTAPDNWLICDGSAYLETAYPILAGLLSGAFKTGNAMGCRAASVPLLAAGNLTAGVLTTLPTYDGGQGYTGTAPTILVVNPVDPQPTSQPTITVSVAATVPDGGAGVTGGGLTLTLVAGGTGITAGALIKIINPTFTALPAGYFHVPDLRGRVVLGAGTESRSIGTIDPKALAKGDDYDATPHAVGDFAGEEKHRLTADELARHTHSIFTHSPQWIAAGTIGSGSSTGVESVQTGTPSTGDVAHNTLPPYFVLNAIIKAK